MFVVLPVLPASADHGVNDNVWCSFGYGSGDNSDPVRMVSVCRTDVDQTDITSWAFRSQWQGASTVESRSVSVADPVVSEGGFVVTVDTTVTMLSSGGPWTGAPGDTDTNDLRTAPDCFVTAKGSGATGWEPLSGAVGWDIDEWHCVWFGEVEAAEMPPTPNADGSITEAPLARCWVDLEAGADQWRANFGADTSNADAGVADTYAWDFGTQGSSTDQEPSVSYPSPDDSGSKWSATVTIDRDGQTADCTIVFDFFGPSHVDGDAGGSGDPDDAVDAGCPATWNVGGYIICWMKRLFVPQGDAISDAAQDLRDAAESNWPMGPGFQALEDAGVLESDATASQSEPSLVDPYHEQNGTCHAWGLPLDFDPDTPGAQHYSDILDMCSGGIDEPSPNSWQAAKNDFRELSWAASSAFAFLAGVMVLYNAFNRVSADGN